MRQCNTVMYILNSLHSHYVIITITKNTEINLMLQLSKITSGSFVCRHNINKQINFFYDGGHTNVCEVTQKYT